MDTTTIHLASQFNATDCIEVLLDNGADPNMVDEAYGGDALRWTESSRAQDAVELLTACNAQSKLGNWKK